MAITPARTIEDVEHGFGLSAAELARALGVSAETLRCWRTGGSAPPAEAWARLREWHDLHRWLVDTFTDGRDGARDWLQTPNRYLAGRTPAELAREGRLDRIEAALGVLEARIFV